jgi:hypothetical protein
MLWFADRFGWRGGWLILLGLAWLAFGVGVFLEPLPPRPWVLYETLPGLGQAIGWWLTGAVAIWQGTRGRVRDDSLGHVALYLMPAVRLISFTVSWLIYLGSYALHQLGVVDATIGYSAGWFGALIWVLVSAMLAWVAGWPNPLTSIPSPPASVLQED